MKRVYSPRGARRGLLLAAIFMAGWCGWALGYTQSAQLSASMLILEQSPATIHEERTSCCRT